MLKKLVFLKIPIFCSFAFFACTSVNEESVSIDCSASDLRIESVNTTEASCATGGSVTISTTGGNGEYQFKIGDIEQNVATFGNLPAGDYLAEVTDGNGCSTTANFTIEGSDDTITATASVEPAECGADNGQITITATGGDENYTFSLNNADFQSGNSFSELAADDYTVTVKDGNGCTAVLTISVNTDISLSNNIMPIIEANCAISGCHKDVRNPMFNSKNDVINASNRIAARTSSTTNPMPPGGRLPQSEIDQILCWVENGASDN